MNSSLQLLLQSIHAGNRSFRPENESHEAIEAFQPKVDQLAEAHALGLVRGFTTRQECQTGNRWIGFAMVHGLSPAGTQYLEDIRRPAV